MIEWKFDEKYEMIQPLKHGMAVQTIQSFVDYWHFENQEAQFKCNIIKYGKEKAIEMQQPKRIEHDTGKVYYEFGHLNKFQKYNDVLIKHADEIDASIDRTRGFWANFNEAKERKAHCYDMLKRWKAKFYEEIG